MKILIIDTSGPVCGTAVMDEERVYSEFTAQNRNTHSANLMPMVENALHAAGAALSDLDAIAAVTGPGSFTGVRIGVATAKGLAHGAGLPCIPVDALEALSVSAGRFDGIICPIQDARAGQVSGAAFRNGERLTGDTPLKLEEFLETISALGDRFLFIGDGVPVHRERITETMGGNAFFADPHLGYLRPSAAGMIALRKGTETDYLHLQATYLRPPNAQKNKNCWRPWPVSETVIRRMRLKDVEQVAALEKATFARPWSRESFRQELTRNVAARYLVAEEEGRVIGYAGAWIILDESHITNIAVAEEARGRGVGRKLTKELMQILSNLGASYATLEVRVSNTRARNLYESLGFLSVGKRKRYYEDNNEDAYLMVCERMPEADPDYTEDPWIEKEEKE